MTRKHSHYFKDVAHVQQIDVYRVLQLFTVTDPCIAHAVKKLLVPGKRGAGKTLVQDVKEAIDSLNRFVEIADEDATVASPLKPIVGPIHAGFPPGTRVNVPYQTMAQPSSDQDWDPT